MLQLFASRLVSACLLFVTFTTSTQAEEPTDMRARFLHEAPKAWAEGQRLFGDSIDTTATDTETIVETSGAVAKTRNVSVRLLRTNGRTLVETRGMTSGNQAVISISPEGAFQLRRDSSDHPYHVRDLLTAEEGHEQLKYLWIAVWYRCAWSFDGSMLVDVITAPGFTLQDVMENDDGSVQVLFDHKQSGELVSHLHSTVVLLPEQHWAVREYTYQTSEKPAEDSGAEVTGYIEYGEPLDGFPVPRRIIQRTVYHKPPGYTGERTVEFETYARREAPDSEFELAAFGVPNRVGELPAPPRAPRGWLLIVALHLFVLAVLLGLWVRRRLSATK